jgi:hypothetical protein
MYNILKSLTLRNKLLQNKKAIIRKKTKLKNFFFKKLYRLNKFLKNKHLRYQKLFIHIKSNNIFYTLIDIKKSKILRFSSSGLLSKNTSKKKLYQDTTETLFKFLKNVYSRIKSPLIINIIAPLKLKRKILQQIPIFLKKHKCILVNIVEKKCFNGCKAPKKQKLKRKLNNLYKK